MRFSRYKKIHDLVYWSRRHGRTSTTTELERAPDIWELRAIEKLEKELKALRKIKQKYEQVKHLLPST